MNSYVDFEYEWSLLSVLDATKQHSRRFLLNVVHGASGYGSRVWGLGFRV